MLTRKLLDVTVKMLGADLVKGSFVDAFEHRPERLDPVGVGHAVYVFCDRVLYCLMVEWQALVSAVVIGVDRRAFRRMIADEALQCWGLCVLYDARRNLVAVAVFHTV